MRYGLIGEKLGHSFSKIIHEQLADYTYDLIPLTRDELDAFLREKQFSALNVTIPYKETVIPYLDEVDIAARRKSAQSIRLSIETAGFAAIIRIFTVSVICSRKTALMLPAKKHWFWARAARPRLSLPFWKNWVHPKLSPYIIRNIRKPSPMQNVIKIMPMQKSS